MAWILGIDASHHVAVGLARDGEPVVSKVVADTCAHDEALILLIQRLCVSTGIAMAGIDAYTVGMGPGPFTGLHVGVMTTRTLATMAGRSLHGMCSLDVITAQWQGAPDEFMVASDTRRREFHWALYHDGIRIGEPRVGASGAVPDLPAAGPVLDDPAGPHHLGAAVLAAHQADLSPVDREPFYLRTADAVVLRTRKLVLSYLRIPR